MSNREWSLNDAVEIELIEDSDFLKIKETLSRIGIPSVKRDEDGKIISRNLYQTCHILHKRGRYYIVHFKIMFALDGKKTEFNITDWARQNLIAKLLYEWELFDLITEIDDSDVADTNSIKIVKYSDKQNWNLVTKYSSFDRPRKRYTD